MSDTHFLSYNNAEQVLTQYANDIKSRLKQYTTMPTPNATYNGKIVQYIGTPTTAYTKGMFYECKVVADSDPVEYEWVLNSNNLKYTIDGANGTYATIQNDINNNIATGNYSHAEGRASTALGVTSHTEGYLTRAIGQSCHSEGTSTTTVTTDCHAEGTSTYAAGTSSHAEGATTCAIGLASHAEGQQTCAAGANSHAEGLKTCASGQSSHAEGQQTCTVGLACHAEGRQTWAVRSQSHAEGQQTTASGESSHAEGQQTSAAGSHSHAEGFLTSAIGENSHAEGTNSIASGECAHAEGGGESAGGNNPSELGLYEMVIAPPNVSFVLTSDTEFLAGKMYVSIIPVTPSGTESPINEHWFEKQNETTYIMSTDTTVDSSKEYVFYEEVSNVYVLASGDYSHAEGNATTASGNDSHTEGIRTLASGIGSHAGGTYTLASGDISYAEGISTTASGYASHAGGAYTLASGDFSHAEGDYTTASGVYTIAMGSNLIAQGLSQTVIGSGNIGNGSSSRAAEIDYAFIIGNGFGTDPSSITRSNALAVRWDGAFVFANDVVMTPPVVLTQTLAAGATDVTFTDSAIAAGKMYDIYTTVPGLNYTAIDDTTTNQLKITYEAQSSAITVKLVIKDLT